MFPPQKILFPVDFSDRCNSAARMVETFTGHFEANLTLLHVLEPLTYNDIPNVSATSVEDRLSTYLVEELKHFTVQRVLLEGDPATRITQYVHSEGFDLVMLPTHGYGAFRRLILGSVTAKILRAVNCPVWTGMHMEEVPPLENIAIRKVLCAVDLGPQTCPTLTWAAKLASEFGAELSVLHAVDEIKPDDPALYYENPKEEAKIEAKANLEATLASLGLVGKLSVVAGAAPDVVCAAAASDHADLVVIGRSAAGTVMGRLKANAYSIIRQSPCPVISV